MDPVLQLIVLIEDHVQHRRHLKTIIAFRSFEATRNQKTLWMVETAPGWMRPAQTRELPRSAHFLVMAPFQVSNAPATCNTQANESKGGKAGHSLRHPSTSLNPTGHFLSQPQNGFTSPDEY